MLSSHYHLSSPAVRRAHRAFLKTDLTVMTSSVSQFSLAQKIRGRYFSITDPIKQYKIQYHKHATMKLYTTLTTPLLLLQYSNSSLAFQVFRPRFSIGSRTSSSLESTKSRTDDTPKTATNAWFPTKATSEDVINYHATVKSLFLRHVLVETDEMAKLAMDVLKSNLSHTQDPFGELAQSLSACIYSREEGGKIGWCDNPLNEKVKDVVNSNAESIEVMLPRDTISALFEEKRPKAGDIIRLRSDRGVHLIRVDDVLLAPLKSDAISVSFERKKLKGNGIVPQAPSDFMPDPETGKKKTYQILTNGCQMNVSDSERLEGELHAMGLVKANDDPKIGTKKADVVLLNTCSIRDHAEQKLYDQLGPIAVRKRKGEKVAVVVAGCVAQQEGEALIRRVPEIDVVMGPQYVGRIEELLTSATQRGGNQVVATDPLLIMEDLTKPVRGSKIRAWVNIIYGCNEHCTYCVVPATRGIEQSRTLESILSEVQSLADAGYKEVTLLGQNIDAYGRDMSPKQTFADLLTFLNNNVKGIERIRYVTSHPRYFSDRVISAIANLDKVCECFHLPFQSGDNEVLKNMRRGYSFESYMKIIEKIKKEAPDASICGDVIVGFPGETDEAFQRTLDLMEAVKFDNLNTFAYSPRPNTEAALWENQVPEDVKSERLQKLQRLSVQHATERSERYLGTNVEVLVEEKNPKNADQVMGRTRQGRLVFFPGDIEELEGKLVNVKVTEARPWSLTGEMI